MLTFFKNLSIIALALVNRILKSLLELLILIDQAVGLMIAIPFYLVIGAPVPNADETISSVVGRYAARGYTWALVAEWIIDRIFYIPNGFKLGHCRHCIEYEDLPIDGKVSSNGSDNDKGKSSSSS